MSVEAAEPEPSGPQPSKLSAAGKELLASRLRRRAAGGPARSAIPRRGDEFRQLAPASFSQDRLWFLDQLLEGEAAYGGAAYHIARAYALRGELDVARLAASWRRIVERHEMLRTRFVLAPPGDPAGPRQLITASSTAPLPVVELGALAAEAAQAAARRLSEITARRRFDLGRGPLAHLELLRLSAPGEPGLWRLLLTLHHIAADGWSLGVLQRELSHLYAGRALAEPALQFADFALWQRSRASATHRTPHEAYWRQRLEGAPPVLELPADRPRQVAPRHNGERRSYALSVRRATVAAAAARCRATPFVVLLAAYFALLARATGQRDLVVGTPVAGRDRTELEGLIGPLFNTLALRGLCPPRARLEELVENTRRTFLGAVEHGDLPFERLVELVAEAPGNQRVLGRSPIYQQLFAFGQAMGGQPGGEEVLDLPGLEIEPLVVWIGKAQLELSFTVEEIADGYRAKLVWNCDLFDGTTMARLVGHYDRLLAALLAAPEQALEALPLLSAAERQALTLEWNDTRQTLAPPLTLSQAIAARARAFPDVVAVVAEDQHLTAADLHRRAAVLAARLLGLGVGPEQFVGVALERSLELSVALLGVLAAGAAYVPLDPSYPPDRLAGMLGELNSAAPDEGAVLLSSRSLLSRLPAHTGPMMCLEPPAAGAEEPPATPSVEVLPEHPAYMIYTSGSTGRPKGVINTHRAIVNRLRWMQTAYPLGADDRVLQKTPISFDVSVWELFWPLLTGARLVMARPGGHQDSAYLVDTVVSRRLSTLHFVPSMLQVFLAQPGVERCDSLRRVFASGEALPAELARRCETRLGPLLHNLYGPTEAAVDVSFEAAWGGRATAGTVPIGRPITNLELWVLDRALELAAPGSPGQLYLGGVGLARGYFRRPGLTAERFVPHPRAEAHGARLYQTGDLVRQLADGRVEFLGRLDHQVKIRGFRIELGEIEAALVALAEVREAVVVAGGGDQPRLVAYVVPTGGGALLPATLAKALSTRLPEHMVPSSFVALPALPLTPSGKVDRKALPEPEVASGGAVHRPPRTELEFFLIELWRAQLGVSALSRTIGTDDDFFALGGNSISGALLVNRLQEVLGEVIHVAAIFDAPTVAKMAARLETTFPATVSRLWPGEGAALEPTAGSEEPAAEPLLAASWAPQDPLPLSFAQERLWFLYRLEPESGFYNLPLTLELEGPLGLADLSWSLAEIRRRHQGLTTVFLAGREGPEARLLPDTHPLPVVELAALTATSADEAARRLLSTDAERPFDLSRAVMRAGLLRLGRRRHLLRLSVHHIATDGWSMGLLARELGAFYRARHQGKAGLTSTDLQVALPQPSIQYFDFALWQRRRLVGARLSAELDFWRRELAGAPGLLALPIDRPRPAVQRFRGRRLSFELAAPLPAALTALGSGQGATLFMTLLAGYAAVLGRAAGTPKVLVGSPVTGRLRPETEGLIGLFVNTLVLAADLGGRVGFRELVARMRSTVVAALAHQELPFERLVQELAPERSLGHSPLVQVILMLEHTPASPPELPGLAVKLRPSHVGTVKFDLNLIATEIDGRLSCDLAYNTDLFDEATARRLAAHWGELLAAAVAAPEQPVGELSLLSAAERHQLIAEWNDTARPTPPEQLLHEPFWEQAARAPEAVAVVGRGETLSYGELARRAERLATELVVRGAGPSTHVAVYLERGPEMAVAVLGVLRAGAAYVPLATSFPAERRRFVLDDLAIEHLVSDAALAPTEPEVKHRLLLPLSAAADEKAPPPARRGCPQELAYVIFTSGSTGTPKGVRVEHHPALNLVRWVNESFGVGPGDRLLFVTALTFDLSVYDLFGVLAAGATVRVASSEELADPSRLARLLDEAAITFWDSAPAALQQLVPFLPERGTGSALRLVFLSGDWIPVALPDRLRLAHPGARVVSLGGATEATVWSNVFPIGAVDPAWTSIPYGRPIDNARYLVLDGAFGLCPVGVPGDLYIGGSCLADGYTSARLTAERWLPSPIGSSGARLYKTGDRARLFADGNLEFLGRSDTQVKVRGFRIELGEIEAVLASHPRVREVVVLVREDVPGDQRLVAYVLPEVEEAPTLAELRAFARTRLPDYMLPAAVVARREWPLSPTGKLDRKALASTPLTGAVEQAVVPPPVATPARRSASSLAVLVAEIFGQVVGLTQVPYEESFFELGGHSLLLLQVQARLEEALGREVAVVDLFRYPTVATLAAFLAGEAAETTPASAALAERSSSAVAVVALAGRFPGAASPEALWANLEAGVSGIHFFSDQELLAAGVEPSQLADPAYVKARGVLRDAELFDAAFFDCSPREAEIMDPQQRLFLELAWEGLELAGYAGEGGGRRVGVFAGCGENTYVQGLLADPELVRLLGRTQISIGNKSDYLPSRVSYKLDLTGPSVNVQTACSTSLAAVHLACRSLLAGECDLALAGGVSIRWPQQAGYRYEEGGIHSPDGFCRAFDEAARGTVGGSGAGLVVLKRLDEALADGDTVRALILGSGLNNDGGAKVGFTAPSVTGQAAAIREALKMAGLQPESVTYIETHGTGTPMGDPIEVAALAEVYGRATASDNGSARGNGSAAARRVALGAVKPSLGHLDAAAGVTGLIKTVLTLEHRTLPPTLHFERPNPRIPFAGTPFYVNQRLSEFPAEGPRRAAVSAFGIGGTNVHAVLEEAPAPTPSSPSRAAHLLLISAKTGDALAASARRLADRLEGPEPPPLADVAFTLQAGRRRFNHRRAVVARDLAGAVAALRQAAEQPAVECAARSRPVAFLFPGQGAQRAGMAAGLLSEPPFAARLREAEAVLAPLSGNGPDCLEALLGLEALGSAEAAARLADTALAQPLLFTVEVGLAELLMSWGLAPGAMLGHSLGEYAAACLAGVFSFAEGLKLVAERGRLMAALPPGAMAVVSLAEAEILARLEGFPELALAAVNAPASCTVSGAESPLAALLEGLAAESVEHRRLATDRAFHSSMVEPMLGTFTAAVAKLDLKAPVRPYLSSLTGTWIRPEEATDPEYWARQLRAPVRFDAGVTALTEEPDLLLVEVGPGSSLSAAIRQRRNAGPRETVHRAVPTLPSRDNEDGLGTLLAALGELWQQGADLDRSAFFASERRRRVPLPTYPFERRPYQLGAGTASPAAASHPRPAPVAAAPSSAVAAVGEVFRDLLGVTAVAPEDDFFSLGGTSLLAVRLAARLREALGVEVPVELLLSTSTVGGLAARLAASNGHGAPSCLVPLSTAGGRRPLFLVHQVGGHVFSFRALARQLAPHRPLYALRSLGLSAGEEPLLQVAAMAERYLEKVREVQPSGPYLVGGASMGGLVALEMARRLLAQGEGVSRLLLLDTPCREVLPGPPSPAALLAQVLPAALLPSAEELEGQSAEAALPRVLERAREAGTLPADFDAEEAARLLKVLSANIGAMFSYDLAPFSGRATYFRAKERRAHDPLQPELPWIELAQGGLEIHLVPGNHATMHDPPHVTELAARLEGSLGG